MPFPRCKLNLTLPLAAIVTVLGLCGSARGAPEYKVLHSFTGTDGSGPWGGVTLGRNGSVYGTTAGGGVCGTVFRLTPQASGHWKEIVLHQFGSGHDPCDPNSTVIFDEAHNLYATSVGGGDYYSGTVFELTHGPTGWAASTLYSFGTQGGDGGDPTAGLVMDKAGNLYGTAPRSGPTQGGTVFELTPDSGGWKETVLYAFAAQENDGAAPYAGLITDAARNFYGTTQYGGTRCGSSSCGTVYELTPVSGGGWKETILHRFDDNGKDGFTPSWGALIMDASGSLYGTTSGGGCCGGVVYKLTPSAGGHWKETILYEFRGGASGY